MIHTRLIYGRPRGIVKEAPYVRCFSGFNKLDVNLWHQIESKVAFIVSLSKPYEDLVRRAIDITHERDLRIALRNILLIDTNGINPKDSICGSFA
jgi:hypothetical protein